MCFVHSHIHQTVAPFICVMLYIYKHIKYWFKNKRPSDQRVINEWSLCKYLFFSSGPPSAPRNLVSLINDTALFLQWMPPSDTGGRKDITYNILCQRCDGSASDSGVTQCEPCELDLRFIPRPLGLTGTSVAILDFAMHANYTFHVEAVNGVSGLGMAARSLVNVTVNTHQAGELQSSCSLRIIGLTYYIDMVS